MQTQSEFPSYSPAPGGPTQIGPYRILRVLGEGGMGVVYEAEQREPIQRRVALKVIRAASASREVVARFEAERQALAVMTHEAIAKVLDAGTSGGQPYFVMELVRGMPITAYCDQRKLTTRERVALYIPVCRAVQHAHQKGVIHRDLKPSNVLVPEQDGAPVPKVIDFGIAKAVDRRLVDRTLVTNFGELMGTPAYMSPEQAESSELDVDTRTDVYSLGVMLYELLVGRLPVDPADLGLLGFISQLSSRRTNAPTPTARLTALGPAAAEIAELRHATRDALGRQLRGELEWILMKALEPERNRRYDTVNALAADLDRYLHHDPVLARPASAAYRLGKFARRHTAAVAGTALVLAAVVTGGVVSTVGMVRATRAEARAREEAATARQVSAFLTGLFRVSAPNRARAGAITARELLDSGAAKIATDLAGQPLVQARLMNTMGDVYRSLGLYPDADRLLVRALELRRGLRGVDSTEIGDNLASLGGLRLAQGRYDEAEAALHDAVRVGTRPLGRLDPFTQTPEGQLVDLYKHRGVYARSDSIARASLAAIRARSGGEVPAMGGALNFLAISQAERGRPAAAESLFRQVLALYQRILPPGDRRFALVTGNIAGTLVEQGRPARAESLYVRALALDSAVFGMSHPSVATDLFNIANARMQLGAADAAIPVFERAIAIWERASPGHPYVASAVSAIGTAHVEAGRPAQAIAPIRRSLDLYRAAVGPDHPHYATSLHNLGVAEARSGAHADAESHLREALATRRRVLDAKSFYIAHTIGAIGELQGLRGEYAAAERSYGEALALMAASGNVSAKERAALERGLAEVRRRVARAGR